MRQRVLVKDIHQHIGKTVLVQGVVHVVRNQRVVQFVIVRDHTNQAIIHKLGHVPPRRHQAG
jgi:aspartyl/asparaginyl-tRNA synthetase